MVFSSLTFLFYFLPIFLLCYFSAERRVTRNLVLLVFSLFFYAWGEPAYIFLMALSIVGNWYFAKALAQAPSFAAKRRWLILSVVVNLGVLGFFKYLPFALHTMAMLFSLSIPYPRYLLDIPLPVGISFYTFQAMSYVIDVYRGRFPPERSVFDLGTYIVMFPQLIAGPIVRYEQIKEQLHTDLTTNGDVLNGTLIFIVGLSFKVLLANPFGADADYVFALDTTRLSMGLAWLGALSYSFQIYFDFAGYSLMAIGLGRVLGFTFPMNFNRPYVSQSITEFWHRWHITLSTWFRDYLYIPLGGNRISDAVTYRNLLIVFCLCGWWHGAAWSFLIWGLYHGLFLILERALRNTGINVHPAVRHAYALLVIVVGWVIFRSESLGQVGHFLWAMMGLNDSAAYCASEVLTPVYAVVASAAIYFSILDLDYDSPPLAGRRLLRALVYPAAFVSCVVYLVVGTHNPFIYFRF